MQQAIFETKDRFPKILFSLKDPDKKVLEFQRQNLNLTRDTSGSLTRMNQSDSWVCVVTDPGLIEELKNDPRNGDKFWQIEKVPTKNNPSTIRSGAVTSGEPTVNISDLKSKAKRLGELEATILLKDGEYSKSASPEEIQEYKNLKTELN